MATVQHVRWNVVLATGFVSALVVTALSLTNRAHAQEAAKERYREECRAQFANLRGPGQQEIVHAQVHACVVAKMASYIGKGVAPTSSFELLEFTPWLITNKGPAAAKGVVYFV